MALDEENFGKQEEPGVSRYGFAIEPGWPVYSADDIRIGEVKDVADTYIRITPRPHHGLGHDVFVPLSTVRSFEARRVVVNYPYTEVAGEERFRHPPAAERGETEAEQHPDLYSP